MSAIAIITARGGSKRIPKKNIKEFCGKPIIAYSIEAALNSGVFDEVMVSTDSMEIAEIARKYGAKVPFMRSESTSNDFATTSDVLIEVIENYQRSGINYNKASCIYPTAPFIKADKLKFAMEKLKDDVDTVIPVVQFSYPPQRGFVVNDGLLQMREPENLSKRSQDLEKIYHDCGQFYCFNVNSFMKTKNLFLGRTKYVEVSELEVQDIDNVTDWKLAELKFKLMTGEM